ncbi:MAG: hypothetical protein JKY95_18685 [Planctomycetaceae bacterium]|nr:hypothetical protein [Planctomycetaceae bacterium]
MKIRWPLLFWQLRQLSVITCIAALLSTIYVLIRSEPLQMGNQGVALFFVLIHSVLITWQLGRVRSREFSFLYGQGFSRDTLWWHTMLASAVSVLSVWLPAAFLVGSGLRSSFQDFMLNYWFPLMSQTEWPFLFRSLLAYAVLMPTFHYCWIRAALPTSGAKNGVALAIGLVFASLSIWNGVHVFQMPVWIVLIYVGGFVLAAISLCIGGMKLHRQVEMI